MKKENDYGDTYHVMNFPPNDLTLIHDLCLAVYDPDRLDEFDYALLNIADRIEKELGIQ